MNIIQGTLILAVAAGIAWKYRPVQKYSWLSLLVSLLTAIGALLSAPPAGALFRVLSLLLPGVVLLCTYYEVRGEYRARRSAARKRRVQQEAPCAASARPPMAG